ncbi:MAG: hypothetical protein QOI15_2916 [Pseudonocardiales bacterium]|nr:hypothetical protein [Pseudonocardiales bacterium]
MLVTGGYGSLGARVSRLLADRGERVLALDLPNPKTTALAGRLARHGQLEPAWVDLTDAPAVTELIARTNPRAVVHLAAILPPVSYERPALAERVNVDGTRHLVDALEGSDARLVLASSLAVYGSRNGAKPLGLAGADTPVNPRDVYGAHKVRAEAIVRAAALDWTILRLGGVIAPDLFAAVDRSAMFMQGIIPADNRIHTVWVDDAAVAFANAIDADCPGRTLMIGGDETHLLRQDEFNGHMLSIAGMGAPRPYGGRAGNPDDDTAWFITDWMDTAEAVDVLRLRPLSISETRAACRAELSRWRAALRPFGRVVPFGIGLASPYRRTPGPYADPWRLVESRYGPAALAG